MSQQDFIDNKKKGMKTMGIFTTRMDYQGTVNSSEYDVALLDWASG